MTTVCQRRRSEPSRGNRTDFTSESCTLKANSQFHGSGLLVRTGKA